MVDKPPKNWDLLTEAEKQEIDQVYQKLMDRREQKKVQSRKCSKCNIFMGGVVGVDLVCPNCAKKIATCVLCGDKSSPNVCPDCIEAGARVCEMCLKPARPGSPLCSACDADYRGKSAANYDMVKEAPPTPGAEHMAGVQVIPSPDAVWAGGKVG